MLLRRHRARAEDDQRAISKLEETRVRLLDGRNDPVALPVEVRREGADRWRDDHLLTVGPIRRVRIHRGTL